jgi:hypothetical protein
MDRTTSTLLAEAWEFETTSSTLILVSSGKVTKRLAAHGKPATKGHNGACSGPLLLDVKREIAVVANPAGHETLPPELTDLKTGKRLGHFGPPKGLPSNLRLCGVNWLPDGSAIVGYANTLAGSGVTKRGKMYRVRFGAQVSWEQVGDYVLRGASKDGKRLLLTDSRDKSWLVTLK